MSNTVKDKLNQEHIDAFNDERGFFLYLRSFSDQTTAIDITTVIPDENDGKTKNIYFTNLSEMLAKALAPFGRFLFIGHEFTDPFADKGLVIDCNEDNWRGTFKECALHARAIFIAPGLTAGVQEEVKEIMGNDFLRKTIWIMRREMEGSNRNKHWAEIQEKLVDVVLPDYYKDGALFALYDNRWMLLPFNTNVSEPEAMQMAFEEMIKQFGPDRFTHGISAAEMLSKLKLVTPLSYMESDANSNKQKIILTDDNNIMTGAITIQIGDGKLIDPENETIYSRVGSEDMEYLNMSLDRVFDWMRIGKDSRMITPELAPIFNELMEQAYEDIKLADLDKLNLEYPELGNKVRDEYLRGLEIIVDVHKKQMIASLDEPIALIVGFINWYGEIIE